MKHCGNLSLTSDGRAATQQPRPVRWTAALLLMVSLRASAFDPDLKYEEVKLGSKQLELLHSRIDKDGDSKVSLEEAVAHAEAVAKIVAKKHVEEALFEHDSDADNLLSLTEYVKKIVPTSFSHYFGIPVGKVMQRHDLDRDGKLTWNEFFQIDEVDEEAMEEGAKRKIPNISHKLKVQFAQLDKNDDEKVSARELAEASLQAEIAKFHAADLDKDGKLSQSEAVGVLVPHLEETVFKLEVAEALKKKDRSQDGRLSKKEFFGIKKKKYTLNADEREDWNLLDVDKDGYISERELAVFESGRFHMQTALRLAWEDADSDGDKLLTADELGSAVGKLSESYAMPYFAMWDSYRNEL